MRANATGRVLNDPRGSSFRFDAGAVCLDFAYSGGEGPFAIYETLHQPADLEVWLAEPPLEARVTSPATGAELAGAKALRQAIWEAAQARAAGRAVPPEVVAILNRSAADQPLVPELDTRAEAMSWASPVLTTQVLSTLAREMIELLSGPLADRIRQCASDDCPMVFVDSSRPGARRWCSMERCGNRAKLRARRSRQV